MTGKSILLALGGILAIVLPVLGATPAAAARVLERCDYYGHNCVRVPCDHNDADRCWNDSRYVRTGDYQHPGNWQCNGDRCRFQYSSLHFGDRDFNNVLERCDYNGQNCVSVRCDHRDNDRCWTESQYGRTAYYQHPGAWQCANGHCTYRYTAMNGGTDRGRGDRHGDNNGHGDNNSPGNNDRPGDNNDHDRPHDFGH